ncbi:MAG: type II secretion system F family protein [Candidatus Nanopelagicales bacterium]|nr:type II secretion system F family protein [Candidatus Nanopelagicales bacterium]
MTVPLAAAALLAGVAVSLVLLPGPRRRAHGGIGRPVGAGSHPGMTGPGPSAASTPGGPHPDPAALAPLTVRGVSALAGVAAGLLVGGLPGAVVGVGVALLLPVVIARLEPARVRRERLELIHAAPLVAELLSAALVAGVPLEHAVPVVARAVGGAAGGRLMGVHRHVELGEPVARAWEVLSRTPGLGAVARAVARSSRTGAPLAAVLAQSAEDLRAQAVAAALAEVRATAVRAVLPLGLCLLPAFALLGIAPIVGGLLPAL